MVIANCYIALELEGLVDARQKLESQQQENQGVQSEFAQLDDDSNIFKMVGPVLLKQEKTEAVMAVNGRLEFIEKEMLVCLRACLETTLTHAIQ
jgi:prefoldin beta subunit